jgi:hypothetical protein
VTTSPSTTSWRSLESVRADAARDGRLLVDDPPAAVRWPSTTLFAKASRPANLKSVGEK